MKFIGIGFGNYIAAERVVAIASPDSSPVKRLMQDAKDAGRAIDVTCGRKTRAVIVTDSEHLFFSALQPETLSERLSGGLSGGLSGEIAGNDAGEGRLNKEETV